MHYYVDGYNLLFRFLHDENPLSEQREAVIRDLNTKIEILDLEVTVVFDAQYQLGETSRSHYNNLEILFSGHGQTADDLILEEVARELHPRQVVVVTSDKKLAWFARRCSANTETVEFFMNWLNRRYKNKLRDIKSPKKIAPALLSAKKRSEEVSDVQPLEKSKPKLPSAASSPEECFDYYLEYFQTESIKIAENIAKKRLAQTGSKADSQVIKAKRKEKKQAEEPIYDHTARWLKIFEKKIKDSDSN